MAYRAASGNGCGEVGRKLDLGLVWRTWKWVGGVAAVVHEGNESWDPKGSVAHGKMRGFPFRDGEVCLLLLLCGGSQRRYLALP